MDNSGALFQELEPGRIMRNALIALFLGIAGAGSALAQTCAFDLPSFWLDAPACVDLPLLGFSSAPDDAVRGVQESRLFRMPMRQMDDGTDAGDADDNSRFQFSMGADNPNFDMRRPGDYGGVGYQRYATQVLLASDSTTSFQVNVEALTPAGPECDGLNHGPSIVFPSLYGSHNLGDGSTLSGFVGKPVRATLDSLDNLDSNIRYGFALQQPLLDSMPSVKQQVFFSIEALGNYHMGGDLGSAPPGGWEIIPGIHWYSSDRCWLSGGVLVPVGGSRTDTGIWQINCSWRF
jgi:hypothetical protein